MAQPTVIVKERLYIPKKLVQLEDLKAAFERHVFNDSGCARCTVYKDGDRFCDICATCEHYRGFYKTWFKKELDGKIYYAVPFGDRRYIIDSLGLDFDKVKVDDRRKKVKAKNPLTFEHELYDGTEVVNGVTMANQKKLVAKYAKYKFGIMKSAPRTGKTVCFTKLICDMGMRTLILADERELLRQAIKTIRRFTNVRELEKETGRKIVGIIQKPSDWAENWDIVLAPYQMFIRDGSGTRRLKKYVVGKFGAIWVDECFPANAKIITSTGIKLIKDVKIGDMIKSFNHVTNKEEFKSVVSTWERPLNKRMVKLKHEHGELVCTEDHPIWSATRNEYVKAKELTPMDKLIFDDKAQLVSW